MAWAPTRILMTLFLTAALAGCEPQTKQRMLNFFFTGVPPVGEARPTEEVTDEATSLAEFRAAVLTPHALFSHPVWRAGVCDPCHGTTGIFSTPGVEKQKASVFKTGGGMPGELILPKNELCIQCHTDKTPKRALVEKLWLHNTTARGDCLACHDPHQSKNKNTLRQPPSILCLPCHEQGKFMVTPGHQKGEKCLSCPVHKKGEECLSCHNPHMGINRNLLTRDYKEIKKPVEHVPGYPELGR